jgi:hypothetical protein
MPRCRSSNRLSQIGSGKTGGTIRMFSPVGSEVELNWGLSKPVDIYDVSAILEMVDVEAIQAG